MPVGMIILLVISVLVFLGLAQRVLDRLQLTDRAALLFIGAMIVGGFLPALPLTSNLSINIGGGIIPIILVIYLFVKAGTAAEKSRAALAILITAVVVYGVLKVFPVEPTYAFLLDPLYIVALVAGVVGYLSGRSRRSAFMAGVGAIVLNDIATRLELLFTGGRSRLVIGGAGIFDAVLISGLIALGLAELIGEIRERLAGGPGMDRPEALLRSLRGSPEEGDEHEDRG